MLLKFYDYLLEIKFFGYNRVWLDGFFFLNMIVTSKK